jgi:hypothetical protein
MVRQRPGTLCDVMIGPVARGGQRRKSHPHPLGQADERARGIV